MPSTLTAHDSSEDVDHFNMLTPQQLNPLSPTRTLLSPSSHPGLPPPTDSDIYTFDQLTSQVPRKASNSSNVKKDLGHVCYNRQQLNTQEQSKSEDIYTFDHLNTNRLQQGVQCKQMIDYDTASTTSPSDDDNQEEYIIEDVLRNIKSDQTYDQLSTADQTTDHLPAVDQQPPELSKKKETGSLVDSPAKPSLYEGQPISSGTSNYKHKEPLSPMKVC